MSGRKMREISDCGPEDGCEECDVCRYLNFLEWAGCVGKPDGSSIERDAVLDAYLIANYPDTFGVGTPPLTSGASNEEANGA